MYYMCTVSVCVFICVCLSTCLWCETMLLIHIVLVYTTLMCLWTILCTGGSWGDSLVVPRLKKEIILNTFLSKCWACKCLVEKRIHQMSKDKKKKRLLDYFLFLKESPGNRIHALDPERSAARWACWVFDVLCCLRFDEASGCDHTGALELICEHR